MDFEREPLRKFLHGHDQITYQRFGSKRRSFVEIETYPPHGFHRSLVGYHARRIVPLARSGQIFAVIAGQHDTLHRRCPREGEFQQGTLIPELQPFADRLRRSGHQMRRRIERTGRIVLDGRKHQQTVRPHRRGRINGFVRGSLRHIDIPTFRFAPLQGIGRPVHTDFIPGFPRYGDSIERCACLGMIYRQPHGRNFRLQYRFRHEIFGTARKYRACERNYHDSLFHHFLTFQLPNSFRFNIILRPDTRGDATLQPHLRYLDCRCLILDNVLHAFNFKRLNNPSVPNRPGRQGYAVTTNNQKHSEIRIN